jgi:hypothetical protein
MAIANHGVHGKFCPGVPDHVTSVFTCLAESADRAEASHGKANPGCGIDRIEQDRDQAPVTGAA